MKHQESSLLRLVKACSLVFVFFIFAYLPKIIVYAQPIKVIYLPDPSTVPLARLKQLDVLDPKTLAKGSNEMSKHKVIIAGISRDNAPDSAVMIKHIETIGSMFSDYRVIIFENDSSDGTQGVLHNWELNNNKIRILSKRYWNRKRANLQFLATARNHYIDTIRSNPEYKDFDILMVADMDTKYGLDIRGIEDSFAQINKWDAVCSNGIFTGEGHMFDMFAFRKDDTSWKPRVEDADQYLYGIIAVPGVREIYPAGSDLVPVHSCFGGLAFYKINAIEGCSYEGGDCEHVPFHNCIRTKNNGKMFLNPSQMLKYSHFREKQ